MRGGNREETSVSGRAVTTAAPGADLPRGLLDLVDQGVVVCDEAGVVVGRNRPAARIFPLLRVGDLLSDSAAGPLASAAGEGMKRFEAAFEGRRLTGHRERLDGHTVWLVGVSDPDLAEQHGSAFLEWADGVVGASLHHGRTTRALARVVLPQLADVAVVVLPVHGRRTSWYMAGPADAEESGQIPAEAVGRVPRLADALSGLQPRAAVFPGRELDGLDVVPDEQGRDGQALLLQLSGNGVLAGVLILVRGPERAGFGRADIDLASRFATRAGHALATAALYSEQAHTTAVVQAELAPDPLPSVEGVALGAAYRPAVEALRISGDFYHVAPRAGGGVSFFFGDVCGKGTEAAVLAGLVKQSLRTLALAESDPLRALRVLNQSLLGGENRFTTLVTGFARPDPDGGLIVATAGGGHLPPLVLRADGRVERIDIDGTLVGVVPDAVFCRREFRLGPGELTLLYSDGVTEARGGLTGIELYGDERLADDLATCRGMPAGAVAERVEILTTQWLAGRPHDDIAVLALQAPQVRGSGAAG